MDLPRIGEREVRLQITAKDSVSGQPVTVDSCSVGITPPNHKAGSVVEWLPVPGFAGNTGTFVIAGPDSDAVDPLLRVPVSSELYARIGSGDDDVPVRVERINVT